MYSFGGEIMENGCDLFMRSHAFIKSDRAVNYLPYRKYIEATL
jgi:hypothetical protein